MTEHYVFSENEQLEQGIRDLHQALMQQTAQVQRLQEEGEDFLPALQQIELLSRQLEVLEQRLASAPARSPCPPLPDHHYTRVRTVSLLDTRSRRWGASGFAGHTA